MKELLKFIISIIILIILFELFCSNTRLSGFIKFAFSSLIVFTAMLFLMNTVTNASAFGSFTGELNKFDSEMITEQVVYLEGIIETRIEIEKNKSSRVEISYDIDENGTIQYSLISVYLIDCPDDEKQEIKKLVQEYLDCQVVVYV